MSDSLFSDLSKVGLNMLSDMDLYESDRKDEELEKKRKSFTCWSSREGFLI